VEDILRDLNPAQREAVVAPDGPILVVAGAGSGKTRVLTTRIAWLLSEERARPAEILAFTFTNRAAREMRERVEGLVGDGLAPRWIGTFHATGVRILRADGTPLGIDRHFSIYDTDDTQRLLKQVLADLQLDPQQISPGLARQLISRWKNDDRDPAEAHARARGWIEERVADVYREYLRALRRANALDFDDLVLRTVHLLERHDEVRARYARRFRHVLVDEFQDTNPLQLVLIKALSSGHGNVFAVGDDDQSIYSWRGARIENMLRFEEYFPGTRILRLEQNYRSTGNILAAANAVISHNRRRKGKTLWTAGTAGARLRVESTGDEEDEAARIVAIVGEELARGQVPQDLAVLYRTNAQSRVLEQALSRAAVPYRLIGSLQFYERREVRDLLAYLKLVANPRDRVAALRILNVPRRRIGAATSAALVAAAEAADLTLGEAAAAPGLLEASLPAAACGRVRGFFDQVARWRSAMQDVPVSDLLRRILDETGYLAYLEGGEAGGAGRGAHDPEARRNRAENVAELVNVAAAFDEATDGARLPAFLEQVALVSDADDLDAGEGAVRLMTIHTAKGLEFPVVVLAGCEEGLLPHATSREEDPACEEERRLFYVALTRAQRRVYLLHARRRRRFGTYADGHASPYLAEIPAALTEHGEEPAMFPVEAGRRPGPAAGLPPLGPRRPIGPGGSRPADIWANDVSQLEVAFRVGQAVLHGRYGRGVVARIEGSGEDLYLTIDFSDFGRKHLLARYANLHRLD
jgi:DNA helicase-2/ATP-dependent DNA helicase PcrA